MVKTLRKRFDKKTKLLPLYQKLKFLRINEIYKSELAKFMFKVHSNNFPIWVMKDLNLLKYPRFTHIKLELPRVKNIICNEPI